MIQSTLKKATTRTSFIEKKKKKEEERNRMQQTDHSETQYSQKIRLQHDCTGACIFSWQLEVSGTFTWIEIPKV